MCLGTGTQKINKMKQEDFWPEDKVARAIKLLQDCCPPQGYYLAFSGGKDSCVIKHLAQVAGVKFDAHYSQTTIDPPELVRFIKQYHPEVGWNRPAMNMWTMVATAPKTPPTRRCRWCCAVYKEREGDKRVKVLGVRAAESPSRAKRWREVTTDQRNGMVVCPIVLWTDEELWAYIRGNNIPYCSLYDEGFKRLGCVGCPLAGPTGQDREFARWPSFERNWKRAIYANWEKWHNELSTKTGEPKYQSKFPTAEAFWRWWRYCEAPADPMYDGCQSMLLWTNTA